MKLRTDKQYNSLIAMLYISVFYPLLERINPLFSYWDEILVVFFLILIIVKRNRIEYKVKMIWLLYILLIVSGVISSIINRYQPLKAVLEDILVNLKFVSALSLSTCLIKKDILKKYARPLCLHIWFVIGVFYSLLLINRLWGIFPTVEGVNAILVGDMLFYEHPTYFAASIGFLICLVMAIDSPKEIKIAQFVLLAFLGMDTGRSKMIVWIALCFALCVYRIFVQKKITYFQCGVLGVVAIFLAKEKVVKYFVTYRTAGRGLMYGKAMEILKDYFWIGSGFATFGSGASVKYYSPLYVKYGLSNMYGFKMGDAKFANDAFWPMLGAQFGIIGLVMYVLVFCVLFSCILSMYKKNKNYYYAALFALMYLTISSTSETTFVNCLSIPFAFLLGVLVVNKERDGQ